MYAIEQLKGNGVSIQDTYTLPEELHTQEEDLKAIGDMIANFANDPQRKLSPQQKHNAIMMREMAYNVSMRRADWTRSMFDPRRDIDDECGYPKTGQISAEMYRELYDREAYAARVVEVLPVESWLVNPVVKEDEDEHTTTAFEEAFNNLGTQLRGGNSKYVGDEEDNPIWEYLLRIDKLSGVGSYGVLLIGVNDGKALNEPLEPSEKNELTFLRCFDESLCQIVSYESDEANPRYGQPDAYNLTFVDHKQQVHSSIATPDETTAKVHWTRVLHVADNLGSSELYGIPRQLNVYNRLYDLRKLLSGSAEMYWKGAFPGYSFETHPQLGGDVEYDEGEMREMVEKLFNGLQRYVALNGWQTKTLAPQVVDPTAQLEAQIDAICIRIGIPKRIFLGSERGELASSQDKRKWHDRLRARQVKYLTPRLVVPFIDRLVDMQILPEPSEYRIKWKDLNTLSPDEEAAIAVSRTEAMMKYVQGKVESLITPLDFLTKVLGYPSEEAEQMIESTVEAMEGEDQLTLIEEEPFEEGEEFDEQGDDPSQGFKDGNQKSQGENKDLAKG